MSDVLEAEKMCAFGAAFPGAKEKLEKLQSSQDIVGSGSGGQRVNEKGWCLRHGRELDHIASEVLQRDSALRLIFPFVLDADTVLQIKENISYYKLAGIVEVSRHQPQCLICERPIDRGDIYIEETRGQGETIHIDEFEEGMVIDGKNVVLRIYE